MAAIFSVLRRGGGAGGGIDDGAGGFIYGPPDSKPGSF